MYVKPSASSPAAIRKARFLAEQKKNNEIAQKRVIVSLTKNEGK